ncbi:hypothetical protein F5X68DRAFT_263293 [Plectosphaerella plurivora]|uniref:Uncharacterized protein n=1 Tax=Plectosphaerella plurivora TaxID=936078 RepID=A0A9P9AAF9_9PEZI|nr:hypothetical protein F5X68DRAFT_263293 [Plectosphaerella plurivora]
MHFSHLLPLLVASATAIPQGAIIVNRNIANNCTILEAPVAQTAALLEVLRAALKDTAVGPDISSLTQGYYDGYGAMLYACQKVFEIAGAN